MTDRNMSDTKDICSSCGKRTGTTISGSITSWIFKESCCTCDNYPAESLLEKPETVTSASALALEEIPEKDPAPEFRRLGERYEVVEKLGQGGTAALYRVHDLVLQQDFAIKVIRPDLALDSNNYKRFQLEARAARNLSHPGIANVYAFNVSAEGIPYLIMDYVQGQHLGDFIAAGKMTRPLFFDIFQQILSALAHAHSRGIIHRDLKPSNILISELGTNYVWVKLVDFGIAKLNMPSDDRTQVLTMAGEVIGSPTYMSPEQAMGEEVNASADLYSLGCVMYEFLAGRPPFVASNPMKLIVKHVNEIPQSIRNFSTERCSIDLERVVLKCLEKDPADRYQNAFDLRSDLNLVAAGQEPMLVYTKSNAQTKTGELSSSLFEFENKTSLYKLFEGRLSFEMRMNNVFERILELGCPGDTLLTLESKNPDFSGVIVIREGYQVLGAKIMKEPMNGYEALKRLVSMADGTFQYSNITEIDYELPDLSLNLNLNFILYAYPSLPESLSELMDQAGIRDLIVAVESDPESESASAEALNYVDNRESEYSGAYAQALSDTKLGAPQNRGRVRSDSEEEWIEVSVKGEKKSPKSEYSHDPKLRKLTHKEKKSKDESSEPKDYKSFKKKVTGGGGKHLALFAIVLALGFVIYSTMNNAQQKDPGGMGKSSATQKQNKKNFSRKKKTKKRDHQ